MKLVVFVTQFYQLSGAEKLALNLARTARGLGHEVCILSMYRRDNPRLAAVQGEVAARTGCRIDYLGLPEEPRLHDVVLGVWRLRRWLCQHKPDLIEASMLGPSTLAAIATAASEVRCIIGIHAVFDRAMHHGLRFSVFKAALRFNAVARVYCVSHAVDRAWSAFAPGMPHLRSVINNVIDERFYCDAGDRASVRLELGIKPDEKIILFVGSLVRNKGIDIVIDATQALLERGNCHLVFVGEAGKAEQFNAGDPAYYQRFRNATHGRHAAFIHLLGHREDIDGLMRAADVLLAPSRSEGSSLVIAEAIACGLPVVASRVGGIPEVLVDGLYGELCEPDDVAAFAAALERVLQFDGPTLCRHRQRLRQRADDFRPQQRVNRLIEFAMLEQPP